MEIIHQTPSPSPRPTGFDGRALPSRERVLFYPYKSRKNDFLKGGTE